MIVVGSTGSDEKVDFLLNELKFDAAFNYKKVDLDKVLSKLTFKWNFFLFLYSTCSLYF